MPSNGENDSMLRSIALTGLLLSSGCASMFGPLIASQDSDPDAKSSRFHSCGTGGFLVGALIDGVVIASDLLLSEEYTLLDGVIIAPFALDILIGAGAQASCGR